MVNPDSDPGQDEHQLARSAWLPLDDADDATIAATDDSRAPLRAIRAARVFSASSSSRSAKLPALQMSPALGTPIAKGRAISSAATIRAATTKVNRPRPRSPRHVLGRVAQRRLKRNGVVRPPASYSSARNLYRVSQEETPRRSALVERVRAQQERHRRRHRLYRIGFAATGFVVLTAGIVMLVTPGPGIPVLILGLAMLALEFAWAERWLERIAVKAEQAVDEVTKGSPLRRALLIGGGLVVAAVGLALLVFWDIPYVPG